MKIKTVGIVLRYFRYGDNGMIAHIYTKEYGRQAFIFKGGSSRATKRKMNFLQPLSLVELPIDYRPQKELYLGNGTQSLQPFQTIPFRQIKSSIAFFLAEVLSKLLQIHESDEPLFDFLQDAIRFLDEESTKGTNFHLTFLVKLMQFLGIQPNLEGEDSLDVMQFNEDFPFWKTFQESTWKACDCLALSRDQRNAFLHKILAYYSFHLQDLTNLKSLSVLQEIFN